MAEPARMLLKSDDYSPNAQPHSLPALHWSGLFASALEKDGPDWIEEQLRRTGWDPQWRFTMYSQAHYHSTTHELLIVIDSAATIQLGGTDERARPRNDTASEETCTTVALKLGDVLLLPAGYTHRLLQGDSNFTMIGSYPAGSAKWDMRFPNVKGCPHDCQKISSMVTSDLRKGLHSALSPEAVLKLPTERQLGAVDEQWAL